MECWHISVNIRYLQLLVMSWTAPIGCMVGHIAYQTESQAGGHRVGHTVVVVGCIVGHVTYKI